MLSRAMVCIMCLALPAVAGCLDDGADTEPAEQDPGGGTGAQKNHFVGTTLEGSVALQTTVSIPNATTCDLAAHANVMLEHQYEPNFVWTVETEPADGEGDLNGGGYIIPYPAARVRAAGVDTRPMTHPAFAAVFEEAYWPLAFPGDTQFTAWSGYDDASFEGGNYTLRVWGPSVVVPDDADGPSNGGSLALGIRCGVPFVVLDVAAANGTVVLTPEGVDGDVDVVAEWGAAGVHQGSLHYDAVGPRTLFWTVGARLLGEVTYAGPEADAIDMDSLDTPASGEFPWYQAWITNGTYEVAWDITGVLPYWILAIASFQHDADIVRDGWSPPWA